MAETNPLSPAKSLRRIRVLVQAVFAVVWLSPFGLRLMQVPGCVFHCYGCPLATLACPVGVVGNFAALHVVPLLAAGVVLVAASLVGSLTCGWACPFGFLQDLLARLSARKLPIPAFLGYGRYVMLLGPVLLVPFLLGTETRLFVCRICPAGALEGGIGQLVVTGQVMSAIKWAILGAFLLAAVVTYRPWCRVFCPLGGFLALFNRISVFHLRFLPHRCTECNTCRSRCEVGVKVEQAVNRANCIRCLECTSCGAIKAMLASPVGGKKA